MLTDRARDGWCSECLTYSSHTKVGSPIYTSDVYLCSACGGRTRVCPAPGCRTMAARGPIGIRGPRYCEHRHDIPGFEKASSSIDDLANYQTLLTFERKNFAAVTAVGTVAAVITAGTAVTIASGGTGLPAAVGGAIGSLQGLTGAAAVSSGLATLGGGSLAAGGLGMAGGTLVVAAGGSARAGGPGHASCRPTLEMLSHSASRRFTTVQRLPSSSPRLPYSRNVQSASVAGGARRTLSRLAHLRSPLGQQRPQQTRNGCRAAEGADEGREKGRQVCRQEGLQGTRREGECLGDSALGSGGPHQRIRGTRPRAGPTRQVSRWRASSHLPRLILRPGRA